MKKYQLSADHSKSLPIKKAVGICIFFLSCFIGKAQEKYRGIAIVEGDVSSVGQHGGLIQIQYRKLAGGFSFDSCKIVNNRFHIEKELNEPMTISLVLEPPAASDPDRRGRGRSPQDSYGFFLLPGTTRITAQGSLTKATLEGNAEIANADTEYKRLIGDMSKAIINHNAVIAALPRPDSSKPELQKRITEVSDSILLIMDEKVTKAFIQSHPNSPVALYALMEYAGHPVWTPRKKMMPGEIESLAKKLPAEFQSLPCMINLKDELTVSKVTGPGRPILDFTLFDTNGKQVKLSDYKGKYVFLDFWASWCVPCRKENPNVIKQFNKFKDKGFTVLSVSLDKPEAREAWLAAIQKDHLEQWVHVSDLKGFDSEVAKKYYVRSIPTNFLISPTGKFLARNLYGAALEVKLNEVFKN